MKVLSVLSKIPDHRGNQGRDYNLASILEVVILSKLCGQKSLASICRFAKILTRHKESDLAFIKTKPHATADIQRLSVVYILKNWKVLVIWCCFAILFLSL